MHTDFAKSPLITPQRLKSEKTADLFRVKPEWDRYIGLVRPDEDLIAEEAVFHSAVAGRGLRRCFLRRPICCDPLRVDAIPRYQCARKHSGER